MLLKLYQVGQPLVRQKAKPLTKQVVSTEKIQTLIDFMIATLRDAPGVGLAAPQVGESLRIIITEDKKYYHDQVPPSVLKAQGRKPVPLKVLINPVITKFKTDTAVFFEGCLSIEGYLAAVERKLEIQVEAWDRHGKQVNFKAAGWQARIIQHEIDHLDGTVYTDRMLPKSFMTIKNFSVLWRKALEPKIKKTFSN